MANPTLLDTTLRDGEQTPGLYFTAREKEIIACRLDAVGIGIIEAGIPSMGQEECATLARLARLGLRAEILSWNRLLRQDLIASFQAGVSSVHLSVPTSDIMLASKLGKSQDWVLSQMEEVIRFAVREGATVSLGAEDASRTDPVFLKKVFTAAQGLGASRVRYADTLGILTPSLAHLMTAFLAEGLDIPIDFHGHNDFGMATANALSAWEGGARIISCSLLGLGERAGNTSLEEFAGAVRYLKGGLHGFDFPALKRLCARVAAWADSPMPPKKPLFGEAVYTHESGIHVDGILKEPATYELFPPEQMGGHRRLVPGKHSGRAAIRHLAQAQGCALSDEQIEGFLSSLRGRMAASRGIDAGGMLRSFLAQAQKGPR
jgi:homocitrate synthase NifV